MNNKKTIILTLIIILGIIVIPTVYKIYKKHNDDLIKVVEKEFLFHAKKCFNEDKCTETVYLKDLYEKDYLKEQLSDPISKKYYSEKSYVNLNTNEINLIL